MAGGFLSQTYPSNCIRTYALGGIVVVLAKKRATRRWLFLVCCRPARFSPVLVLGYFAGATASETACVMHEKNNGIGRKKVKRKIKKLFEITHVPICCKPMPLVAWVVGLENS